MSARRKLKKRQHEIALLISEVDNGAKRYNHALRGLRPSPQPVQHLKEVCLDAFGYTPSITVRITVSIDGVLMADDYVKYLGDSKCAQP